MSSAFPILFIAEARPEDAVMSSGLIRFLREEAPGAAFTIAAGPESAPLLRDTPGLEALHVLKGDRFSDWFDLWSKVRDRKWGLIVDLRGSGLSGWLQRQKRAVRGAEAVDGPPPHKTVQAARALKLDQAPAPHLYVSEETQAAADALLGDLSTPLVAVGPGADWAGKVWPAERFTKTLQALLGPDGPAPDGRLLIVGGEGERDAAQTIRYAVPRDRLVEAYGKLDPLTTCAALRRARFYVGGDSLWTHLAAAAGAPTLALFGPSDDALEAPYSPVARVVRTPRSLDDFRAIDPGLNQAVNHMMDLQPEAVIDTALKLWADTEPKPVLEATANDA